MKQMSALRIKAYVFVFFNSLFVVGLVKSIELMYAIPTTNDEVISGIPTHIALYLVSAIVIGMMLGLIYYVTENMIEGLQNKDSGMQK